MGLIDSLNNGKFVVLTEIDPPKGVDTSSMIETVDPLKGRVDALMVTDMPSAVMRLGSLCSSYFLQEKGFETVCNLTCRDRNVLALQSDLLSAAALGLRNIYISEGDDITYGDHPKATPVNEVCPDEFLEVAKKLKENEDSAGNKLDSAPSFNIGGFVNAGLNGDELDREINRILKMEKHGAAFVLTQAIFDLNTFGEFIKKVRSKSSIPIIAGLILLKSVATARFLNMHVDGVSVPDAIIERLYSAGDKQKESISITAELISGLREICQGVNLVAMGWESKIPAYLDAGGL